MHSYVHARIADREGEREERGGGHRHECRQHRRCGEGDRRVARRERMAMRDRDQGGWVRGAILADRNLQHGRDPVGRCDRQYEDGKRERPSRDECEDEADRKPDDPIRSELRKPYEHVVQRMPPVVGHPTLRVAVPARQTGTICFVCSISCCMSNGLPMNACAPPADPCASVRSSTLPLNITTGIAPAPY